MTIAAPDTKRRALGKGLDSLLPRVPSIAATPAAADAEGGKPLEIHLDQIDRNPFQTRSQMNEEQLGELAASISANGVVQPILVRPLPNGRFQLIAGERRWRASELAKKPTIPAILRQVSDEQAMEITIVENLQRADLNAMEQARAFERLAREFHMTQEQMAVRTGKDRATVANFLRLLKLPSSVQARVESGELSFGHARTLLAFEHAEEMEKAAQRVVALSLSVRQTESYVSRRPKCPCRSGAFATRPGAQSSYRRQQWPRQSHYRIRATGRLRSATGAVGGGLRGRNSAPTHPQSQTGDSLYNAR